MDCDEDDGAAGVAVAVSIVPDGTPLGKDVADSPFETDEAVDVAIAPLTPKPASTRQL